MMDRRKYTRKAVVGASIVAASFATQQSVSLAQQAPPPKVAVMPDAPPIVGPMASQDGPVVIDGLTFKTWNDYFTSAYFRDAGKRCGTIIVEPVGGEEGGIAGGSNVDCGSSTNPAAIYAAAGIKYRIPVVFHAINNGVSGILTDTHVQSNIVVMNEDFLALAGTPGAPGANAQVEFFLTNDFAAALGGGATTGNGIMRYNNATWYADGGAYYNTIGRDPINYLNIYSNNAGGNLGYVPFLPHTSPGSVGTLADRVVSLWSAVGDPCPVGGIYCTGRTITHEVGHYLGLGHTFQGGCASDTAPTCYSTGDWICDTPADGTAHFGCPVGSNSCATGGLDPIRNYMEYTDDLCMDNFTQEQIRRCRCTLEHRRTALPIIVNLFPGNYTGTPNVLAVATNTNGTTLCDAENAAQPGRSDGAGDVAGAYTGSGWSAVGDEVAYRINHPGGNLKVLLSGLAAGSDLDLYLMPAAGTPVSCIGVSTIGSNNNELIVKPALAAGTYYAVVETFTTSPHSVYGSNFTIRYSRCLADIVGNNNVDVTDLLAVPNAWGACPTACAPRCGTDIEPAATGNCATDVSDLLMVINGWGPCP